MPKTWGGQLVIFTGEGWPFWCRAKVLGNRDLCVGQRILDLCLVRSRYFLDFRTQTLPFAALVQFACKPLSDSDSEKIGKET